MKIASWNVNSLNVRLPHVLEYLRSHRPDILVLQETKLPDEKFPEADITAAGYHAVFSGQKTYNGVAILSRNTATDIVTDIPGLDDPQRRMLAASIDGIRIINIYVPNGQEVGSEKYDYKFRWLNALREFLAAEMLQHKRLLLLGDYNIAPADIDVHNPERWRKKIMCSGPEREIFHSLLALGLTDAVRDLHLTEPMYSWWDYRLSAFRRGWGLRIDHILVTDSIRPVAAGVDANVRGQERPSDHAPVWLEFE